MTSASRLLSLVSAIILSTAGAGLHASGKPQLGSPTGVPGPQSEAPDVANRWVTGYYLGYFWDWYPPAVVDMSTMTHFVFARYSPGGGALGGTPGQVVQGAGTGHDATVEQFLVNKAHTAGIKALAMLGGAGDGAGFDASTVNVTIRTTFINNILTRLAAKNYDGVDVDWEENLSTAAQQAQVLALLSELRTAAAAHPHFQPPHAPIIITWPAFWANINFATVTPWHVQVAARVDQYNLMTYSMAGAWPGWDSWHHSPLGGAQPTYPTGIDASVAEYVAAGVPRAKLGIGIGLYGIYYGASINAPRQPLGTSSAQSDDIENNYRRLLTDGAFSQPGGVKHWDPVAKQSYYSYSPAWNRWGNTPIGYLTYEDEQSIAAKGDWVRQNGVGGTIVWALNYGCTNSNTGANALMTAVKTAFITTTPVELMRFSVE